MLSMDDETMSGPSGVPMMRWPRAITRAGTADAAMAEATAYRRWVRFTLRCHLRHVLVGENMRPPRHMLPNAPWPERCVPPPCTRGMRDTARPVPHEAAEGIFPAYLLTQYGWRLFRATRVCTKWTTSGRIGDRNTPGSAADDVGASASPSTPNTVQVGRLMSGQARAG